MNVKTNSNTPAPILDMDVEQLINAQEAIDKEVKRIALQNKTDVEEEQSETLYYNPNAGLTVN